MSASGLALWEELAWCTLLRLAPSGTFMLLNSQPYIYIFVLFQYDDIYIYIFSKIPGSPAATLESKVDARNRASPSWPEPSASWQPENLEGCWDHYNVIMFICSNCGISTIDMFQADFIWDINECGPWVKRELAAKELLPFLSKLVQLLPPPACDLTSQTCFYIYGKHNWNQVYKLYHDSNWTKANAPPTELAQPFLALA